MITNNMPKREKKYVSVKKCKRTTVQYIIQNPIVLRQPPLWLVTAPYEKKSSTFRGVLATANRNHQENKKSTTVGEKRQEQQRHPCKTRSMTSKV
jgi:hypothetical protein